MFDFPEAAGRLAAQIAWDDCLQCDMTGDGPRVAILPDIVANELPHVAARIAVEGAGVYFVNVSREGGDRAVPTYLELRYKTSICTWSLSWNAAIHATIEPMIATPVDVVVRGSGKLTVTLSLSRI